MNGNAMKNATREGWESIDGGEVKGDRQTAHDCGARGDALLSPPPISPSPVPDAPPNGAALSPAKPPMGGLLDSGDNVALCTLPEGVLFRPSGGRAVYVSRGNSWYDTVTGGCGGPWHDECMVVIVRVPDVPIPSPTPSRRAPNGARSVPHVTAADFDRINRAYAAARLRDRGRLVSHGDLHNTERCKRPGVSLDTLVAADNRKDRLTRAMELDRARGTLDAGRMAYYVAAWTKGGAA